MFSFRVEEEKGLTYHLEGLRVPLKVRVPQFWNHWSTLYIQALSMERYRFSAKNQTL